MADAASLLFFVCSLLLLETLVTVVESPLARPTLPRGAERGAEGRVVGEDGLGPQADAVEILPMKHDGRGRLVRPGTRRPQNTPAYEDLPEHKEKRERPLGDNPPGRGRQERKTRPPAPPVTASTVRPRPQTGKRRLQTTRPRVETARPDRDKKPGRFPFC